MSELSELLAELPVPDHRPGFWEELEARLVAVDAEKRTATLADPIRSIGAEIDLTPSTARRRRRRWAAAAAAAAALVAAVVGLNVLSDNDDPRTITDTPPTTTTTADTPTTTTVSTARTGSAEETWLPGSAGRAEVIPWQGGFAAVLALTSPMAPDAPDRIEAEVWLSPDGIDWQQSSNVVFPPSFDVVARTDGEHLVVRAAEAWYSTDDLATWQQLDVPSGTHVASVLPDGWVGLLGARDPEAASGQIVTGNWDGDVVIHDESSRWQATPYLLGPDGGLGDFFDGLAYTADWVNWTDAPPPPWGQPLHMLARTSDRVVAVSAGIWLGEPDGSQWEPVEHPRLDGRTITSSAFRAGFGTDAAGFVAILDITDYGDVPPPEPLSGPPDETYPPPEFVLVASPDGANWLVEDVDLTYENFWAPPSTSISGNGILVHYYAEEAIDLFEFD